MRGEGGYAVAKAAMSTRRSSSPSSSAQDRSVQPAIIGWLDGPGVRFFLTMTAEQKGVSEQEVYDDIASRNPLGRIPTDEACAGAILFLLSSYASEMTGAVLDVNGGEHMPA
jgi:NAD(P)-dependent dehydrogenase (short-subunit alcohol dehydrogenase family)